MRRFSTVIRLVALLVVVLPVCWGLAWVAARALVTQVSLPSADALLVLSGAPVQRERTAHAARLFLAGRAKKLIITNDGLRGAWSHTLQKNPLSIEQAVLQLTEAGVPHASIEILPEPVSSTYDEAVRIRQYARDHELRSLIVVTSMYHTRRALWTLRRVLRDSSTEVGMEPADPGPLTPSPATWMWSARGWSTVAGEYVKLAYYRLHYS